MQGLEELLGSSGIDLGSLAARFGLSPDQTRTAVGSLVPPVVGGFQKKAEAGDLDRVSDAAAAVDQPETAPGNDILGHIFGSKDVSRQVADHAAGQSGVSSTVMKAMLPIVAAMVAKHLSNKAAAGGGGLGGLLGGLMGGQAGGGMGGLGGLGGLLGGSAGGGNPLDSILAGFGGQR